MKLFWLVLIPAPAMAELGPAQPQLVFFFFHKIVSAFGPVPTISGAYVLTLVILVT